MKIKEYRSYFNGLEIEKPFNNKKKYKITTLENDLEVLLISDSEAIQSSASLNISIGSAYDPEDIPGLAHFCEHLLFMGTEKYPEESEYNQFLSQNGGYSNAYTTFKETNFFFEVNNNSLEACLDRFSQFFISPLFDASCTEREMLSVNSEHMNNIQTDSWRISQIERNYSNPNHPYHKFYTGNFETLNVPDIRNHVIEFYNKHYSSNLMKLVILGNESIDILYKWAKQYFSKIENKNLILEEFKEPPLTKEYLMKEIYIKPIMDMSLLIIIFPVPNANKYYKEKPYHYFTHLIGHEGKGSIISYLKSKDLAYSIEVGNSNIIDDFDNFKIEISLTEKGLSNYEEVIEIVFQYIEMLKKEGVQEWIYNELETMSKCIFLYEDKDHNDCLVASLSSGMQINYPRHQILSGPYIVRNFDPGLIEDLLNYFTCENFRYILVNQDLELENTIIDKWYGTEYSIKDIPMDIMKKFKNITINKKLHLPERNKFIPEKININYEIPNMNSSLIPELIKNNDKIRMFYKKDDQFNNPKTNITISFISPQIDGTPLDHLMTIIYVGLFEESISEMAYYASLAGIYYNLTNGLTLSICGYNNHILYYLEKFFTAMITLKFTDKEFYNLKDQLKTAYQNSKYSNSSQYAHSYLSYLLSDNSYLTEDLLKEIDDITPSNIMEFYPKIFSRLFIEGFIHGSLSKSESKIVVNIIEKIFNSKSLSLSKRLQNRCIKLPEGKSYIYKRLHSDGDNPNSAVQYYIEISERTTVDKRAMISLLVNLLDEPCFNYLRTQEQLGYIVTSGRWNMSVTSGIYILVQSEKSCLEIESYIEQFLIEFRNIIEKMDNDDFNRNVKLTMEMFQDKHKTLEDEHSWTWNLISSGFYEFNIREKYIEYLKKIEKKDLLKFYDYYVLPTYNKKGVGVINKRKKLSIHICSQKQILMNESIIIDILSQIDKYINNDQKNNNKNGGEEEEEEDKSSFCDEIEFLHPDKSPDGTEKDILGLNKSIISDEIDILSNKSPINDDPNFTISPETNSYINNNVKPIDITTNKNMISSKKPPKVSPINCSLSLSDRPPPLYKCMTMPSFYHSNYWWKKDQILNNSRSSFNDDNNTINETFEIIDLHHTPNSYKKSYIVTPVKIKNENQKWMNRRVKSICIGIHNYNQNKINIGYKTYISKLKSYILKKSLRMDNTLNVYSATTPINIPNSKRKSNSRMDNLFSSSFKESISEFYTPNLIQESLDQKELLNNIDDYKLSFNWTTSKYVRNSSFLKLNENKNIYDGLPFESISQMIDKLETSSDFITYINNITISINNIKKIHYSKNSFLIKSLLYELDQIMDITTLLFKQNYPENNLMNNEMIKYSSHIINDEIQSIIINILDNNQNENYIFTDKLYDENSLNNNLTLENHENSLESKIMQENIENNNEEFGFLDQMNEKELFEKKQNDIIDYTEIIKNNNIFIKNMDKFKCNQILSKAPLPVNSFPNLWASVE